MRTDLSSRLQDGRMRAREKYKEEEKDKLGILRAGNSGVMSEEGDVAGACHRLAYLRSLGMEIDPPDDSRLIMFQLGTANEEVIYQDLLHTKAENEVILRETEIPISWTTSNGTKVTGRPDMVILRKDGDKHTPVFGVEIKSIASVWTSREVMFDGTPKFEHLVQAAHYSWKLGCPFKLMYKQYANQAVPQWAQKFFPKEGEKNSEHIEYNDKGDIKSIKPFELVYELEITPKVNTIRYRREGHERWSNTPIKVEDIQRFYEFVSKMKETKDLGPLPLTLGADGKEKNFSKCGYCPLQDTCKKVTDHDTWLKFVKKLVR